MLFYEGATVRCVAGIPPDAVFLGVYADPARMQIVAHFEHPSFEPRPYAGGTLPNIHVAFEVVEHASA